MVSCTIRSNLNIFFAFLFLIFTGFASFAQDQAIVSDAGVVPGATAGAAAASGLPDDPAVISAGESLFKNNCAQCHAVTADVVVGPGLQNVHKRRPLPWILNFVKNSQRVIQSGDPYAVELYNKFNKTQMPSFALSDDEITSVIAYVASQEAVASGPVGVGEGGGAGGEGAGFAVDERLSGYLDMILIVLVVVLIVMVITLLLIASILRTYLKQNKALTAEDAEDLERGGFDYSRIYKSRPIQIIVGIIFVLVLVRVGWNAALDIGVQQGYAPSQPIAFSHALHAGEHAIDCNYCHTSVYKSASANIPSANICMNCHSQIATQSAEIQKIYKAIERNRPIEWVRVHNLPDLAYFNHSQHTQVGGVACQTCHGPIQEMEVVAQWSPLTMGWCINCHRETTLQVEGNGYYSKLEELHLLSGKTKGMTVSSNGGTECSKCHY